MPELAYIQGRLDGLAGTVRYDLPDSFREELREVADMLRRHSKAGLERVTVVDTR